ncbi:phage tail protein [Pseudomonas sp. zfem003]|uniref:phage tail protein n=1 Tax=Pseudomonas sp. zfem003 TaxID=3078198 RepID=UPI002928D44B|nr:phage tail protein [Pseudomonas sp. zfem003]MDU9395398.1 phage tail protein [Pseudomonas sp. zfem003]
MNKPSSLRRHLLASVPDLQRNPDRLLVFIDNGTLRCTAARSLSWEYNYDLQVILTDYAGDPDLIMLPLLGWLRVNQPELLANLDRAREAVSFEVDILDNDKADVACTLRLTERVVVSHDANGQVQLSHPGEPQPSEALLDPDWPAPGQGNQDLWYVPHG